MRKYGLIVTILVVSTILFVHTTGNAFFGANEATIGFTGDIMMHIRVKKCASINGFDHLFERIAPELKSVDFMSGNMEFPVSPPFKSRGIIFNAPKGTIPAMKKAGFDILVLANNHILDQGHQGLFDTIGFLEKYSIPYLGVGRSMESTRTGYTTKINGITVGMMAYAGLVNYPGLNNSDTFHINWIYQKKRVLADIASMKKRSDYVIMQIHTGVEYVLEPRNSDRLLFQEYLDAGVDLIIGHHPHMLQSMETYTTKDGRKTEIFYSLGNFISDQTRSVAIRKTAKSISIKSSAIIKVNLKRNRTDIVDTFTVVPVHSVHEFVKKDGVAYKNIQTVPLKDLIKESAADKKLSRYYKAQEEAVKLTLFKGALPSNVVIDK
ncbi:MAG: CapA family protein [Spirochaetes bacterium]|jgi:poly-gamma-glutamate capsule biosynthesis protein CapA/YwtB (metallophosphatase superfamily)|nr:CapA family protein [Spirochaetota bacterium]